MWRPSGQRPQVEEGEVPHDCLECRLIGSGAMLSLSGWFFYHSQGMARAVNPTHLRFNAAMGVGFACAGVYRFFM